MRQESLVFECEVCGLGSGAVENDLGDDQEDTQVPAGWVQVICRRVQANPDYEAPRTEDEILDDLLAGVPDANRAEAAKTLEPMAHLYASGAAADPSQIIDEVELHYCPTCAQSYLFALEGADEAFADAEWAAGAGVGGHDGLKEAP